MKRVATLVLVLSFITLNLNLFSQTVITGVKADNQIKGTEMIRINDQTGVPNYIKFRQGSEVSYDMLSSFITDIIKPTSEFSFKLINTEEDNIGNVNYRYYQTYQTHTIQGGMFIVHVRNGMIFSINGDIQRQISLGNTITLSEQDALKSALSEINADQYMWQIPGEEDLLKKQMNDPTASYYPKGEIELYYDNASQKYYHTYKFDIYTKKPLSRADCYVDASTGKILFKNNKIHLADVGATALTKYSGIQKITTDSVSPVIFRLREAGRGNGVETYNMLTTTNYAGAVDFLDSNNYWNNVNTAKDEVATDAHWGSEMTYDFYKTKFNRNSLDGNGLKLLSYVHYDVNYANAFWDGQRMTYGDGSTSSGMGPLTAIDICGHEMTHGVDAFTANLNYSYESGAMNEGFSDIMGMAVKFYAKPASATWLMGPDIGVVIRSMSNPNAYQQPDTYHGTYWTSAATDNGGVHTNSGVINYWYYLLCMGGTGTNDIGNTFNVAPLGLDTATRIAYRLLTTYLTPASQYADARFYAIIAASDLYGACSPAVQSTTNAMYAVGIGSLFTPGVQSNFNTDITAFCQTPAKIVFNNQSNNGLSYHWDFGDGTTSTTLNPTHIYNNYGNYTVKLLTNGGGCGMDSITKVSYISVLPTNPCIYQMPVNGIGTISACSGILLDNGASSNYIDNTNPITIIAPTGATSLALTFSSFNYQTGSDFLSLFNGPDTLSPLIGNYSGTSLPAGGSITASSGAVTLKQRTNVGTTAAGFVMSWQATFGTNPTVCNFKASDTISCSGIINFSDNSSNCPNQWHWDFGDGGTDISQNPTHNYLNNGTYNVKLRVVNPYGTDSITKVHMITVAKPLPPTPAFTDTTHCGATGFTVSATKNGTGNLKWFDSPTSTMPIDTGSTHTTPLLTNTLTLYVEMQQDNASQYGGKMDSTGGTFTNYTQNAQRGIIFNCSAEAKLVSVLVWAQTAGNRTIQLWDHNDSVILSKVVNIPAGKSRVYLNIDLPIQDSLKLYGPVTPNLFRGSTATGSTSYAYPFYISNLVTLLTSTATTGNPNNYYYYFFSWEVKPAPCKSSRVAVNLHISTNPPNASFTYNSNTGKFIDTSTQVITYKWDFGDGSHSTSANPIHFYAVNGTYTAKLITINACGTDSSSQTITITNAAINEINFLKDFTVYPNPANESVTISLTSETSTKANLFIFDLIGKAVYNEALNINTTEYYHKIDIGKLGKGIYFITLKANNTTISRKLIVY